MPIFAYKGIIAGSPHGTTLARLILLPILRQAQAQAELAQMWTFVDDTVLRAEGVLRTLLKHLPSAAKTLCDGLKEFELPISDKTVLIGSTPKVRKLLAKKLRLYDIPVTATAAAVDLGVDAAAATRRVQAKARKRQSSAAARFRKIHRLRSTALQARISAGLWRTGALPEG
eukprot:7194161-Pyramimonas_sp.AAC.1